MISFPVSPYFEPFHFAKNSEAIKVDQGLLPLNMTGNLTLSVDKKKSVNNISNNPNGQQFK